MLPTKGQQKASEAPVDLAGLKNREMQLVPCILTNDETIAKVDVRSALHVDYSSHLAGHGLDSVTASETQPETLNVSTSKAIRNKTRFSVRCRASKTLEPTATTAENESNAVHHCPAC